MTDIKRIGTTGIHTVEGNVAGARAARLTKQRDVQKAEYESIKNKIKEQNASQVGKIDDKFNTGSDILEQEFRKRTVGLVSASDFRKAREVLDENQKQLQLKQEEEDKEIKELELEQKAKQKEKERQLKRKKISATLSFNIDQEDTEDLSATSINDTLTEPVLKKRLTKDPTIDTTFLPDRERDAKIEAERKRLQKEWLEDQERIKNEMLEVTYSYWDGSGHRKSVEIKKGTTILRFLEIVKTQLTSEFYEVKNISADSLLYVKEDLIIPHHYTFYDLIVTKARGKSGPLFHFDVHDDIRLYQDSRIEKDESHPGKVVERRWYERNKHIFPASRWEVYDPLIERSNYSIHGNEVNIK